MLLCDKKKKLKKKNFKSEIKCKNGVFLFLSTFILVHNRPVTLIFWPNAIL
jgi:hypothetical protein